MSNITDRLKLIRKHFNLSQAEFGSKIGLSQTTIGQYETGVRVITERSKLDICRVFNVDYEWLVHGTGEPFSEPSDDEFLAELDVIMSGENGIHKNMIKALISCSEEELQALDSFIKHFIKQKE